jgi:hypothetical protein
MRSMTPKLATEFRWYLRLPNRDWPVQRGRAYGASRDRACVDGHGVYGRPRFGGPLQPGGLVGPIPQAHHRRFK